jgi:hypothetical protein
MDAVEVRLVAVEVRLVLKTPVPSSTSSYIYSAPSILVAVFLNKASCRTCISRSWRFSLKSLLSVGSWKSVLRKCALFMRGLLELVGFISG